MRVYQQQERIVTHWFALEGEHIRCIAAQQHSETSHERRRPFFFRHLVATRIEPHHISNLRAGDAASFQKLRTPKNRVFVSQLYQFSREFKKLILFFVTLPVKPTNFVVLTISVVVAILGPTPLISAAEHRYALGKKQCGEKIAPLTVAQCVDLRIIGWTFGAAIP